MAIVAANERSGRKAAPRFGCRFAAFVPPKKSFADSQFWKVDDAGEATEDSSNEQPVASGHDSRWRVRASLRFG